MIGLGRGNASLLLVGASLAAACGEGLAGDAEAGLLSDGTALSSPVVISEWKAGRGGYIELQNVSDQGLELVGFKVDDGAGGSAAKPVPTQHLNPRDVALVPFAGINGSSADRVRLIDPSGAVVEDLPSGYAGESVAGQCFGRAVVPDSVGGVEVDGPVVDRAIACTPASSNWVDARALRINEVRAGAPGYVELFNPADHWVRTATPPVTDPSGEPMYLVIDGSPPMQVRQDIAPRGVLAIGLVLTSDAPVRIKLLTAAGVELDSVTSAPPGAPIAGRCFGRIDDGGAWVDGPVPCSRGVSNFLPGQDLVVNELKTGSGGFIEIFNRGTSVADLSGFAVDDVDGAGSSPRLLPAGTTILPGGFLQVPYNGVNKSSADWARIVDAAGNPVDAISTGQWADRASGCIGRSPDGGEWAVASRACSPGGPNGVPPTPVGGCSATGGTIETVAFTAEQECKAVEYLNRARFSELGRLPDLSRNIAYDCGPTGCRGYRQAAWRSVVDFAGTSDWAGADTPGPAALRALREASSSWTDDGQPFDTIASTYAHRGEIVGRRVTLEKIWIERLDATNDKCVVARDAPGAPNFLYLCEVVGFCHDGCAPTDSVRTHVGEYIWVRGLFGNDPYVRGGAWEVHDPTVRVANPAVP